MSEPALPQKIAILGATSQIARDLVVLLADDAQRQLFLFARRHRDVEEWLASVGLAGRYAVGDFSAFPRHEYDAVINFVGVGNPARLKAMGNAIFDVTLRFDEMVLEYLRSHPACRYLFLSSGTAYGARFDEPVKQDTPAIVPINALSPSDWYGVAKLHAECRHRAYPDLPIVDIRVFNYFSRSQDLNARFFVTDILRAIRDKHVLKVSPDRMVRDFVHPSDFAQLVGVLLAAPAANAAIDCYSRAPIDKAGLLTAMREKFGLTFEVADMGASVNATGHKPNYYSLNRRAADFGYQPKWSSLETILGESAILLANQSGSLQK